MKRGRWEMGSFWWTVGTPREVKRLAFLTKVMSAAASGMESYSCSEMECTSLDKVIVKYLKTLMKGKVYKFEDGKEHGVSLTNVQVLQKWRVCPVELELACRRIRWLQSMVEHPEEHAHIIALLWGHSKVDGEDRALDEMGFLTEEAPTLSWMIQMDFDLLEIS